MNTIELLINDSMIAGFDALALVESPAIEQDFYAFNKKSSRSTEDIIVENLILDYLRPKSSKFAAELKQQQMFVSPLMRANYLIPRLNEETGEEYNVFFSAETIKKIAYKTMMQKKMDNVNLEHDSKQMVDGVFMVETWIVEDPEMDKACLYGFECNKGDWYAMYKVANKEVWDSYIKSGKVKGVSVEGYFLEKMLQFAKECFVYPETNEQHDAFMSRCMATDKMITEFPDESQRYAVCHTYWLEK